jgi:hypothetical protein
MPGRGVLWLLTVVLGVIGIAAIISCNKRGNSAKPNAAAIISPTDKQASIEIDAQEESPLPRLPEKEPPAGLPIVAWGKRGHFPVIRKPQYLTAEQGDRALARDEPVLGLVIGKEARAYSTNQLNDHEMVVDTIADTPVLVSY